MSKTKTKCLQLKLFQKGILVSLLDEPFFFYNNIIALKNTSNFEKVYYTHIILVDFLNYVLFYDDVT